MTGKRKSGRKSGSSSKKETPEKTRRSSRRRGHKKSDSEDDSGSEQSVDGREERMETPKKEDLSKEDESGGSDGAWQVRSENGNKGGIPKLKISLHRPAETSSPTPEPLSSPKPRRSRRGAANEEASEDGDDAAATGRDTVSETSENEGERRSSKSRKRRDKEGEHSKDTSAEPSEDGNAADDKDELEREAERKGQEEAARLEQERKLEEERKIELEKQRKIKEEEEAEARKKAEEEEKERQQEKERLAKQEVEREKEARRKSLEEKEKEARRISLEKKEKEKEARRKSLEEKEREARKKEREEKEREAKRKDEEEKEAGRKEKEEAARAKSEEKEEPSKVVAGEEHGEKGSDAAKVEEVVSESIDAGGEKVDSDVEVVASRTSEERPGRRRSRRTPSRDSSEERAKQAALASRKPKGTAESEDGEVPDSPEREVSFPVRTEGKIRTSASTAGSTTKENQDQPVVRKRRWGSSNSNQSAKKPLSISTDVLKEIIPEVKPVALSEVELSLQKEEIVLDDDKPVENRSKPEENSRTNVRSRRRRDVSSDESEKDYEEEAVDSDGEEMVKKKPPAANHMEVEEEAKEEVKETSVAMPVRKTLPADPLEALSKQRSPSPARHPVSNILFITNLVRPFTVVQLRDLLARTGTIAEEKGFWIDTIKSKCYVKYTSEEDAKNTRHALHGVRWPVSNPKQLNVDFSTEAAMSNALEGGRPVAGDADRHAAIEERLKRDREREVREKERRARDVKEPVAGRLGDLENGREVRRVSDRERERERDRETRDREGDRERRDEKPMRTVRKVTLPVREWDLGKAERGFSPPTDDNRRFAEVGRKRDQDRQRSLSLEPQKKSRRRDELSPPKKILDDLFRKTKTTPCIYWLPLSEQQIAEKETQRRKHMEEHEKRIVEERKRREAKRRRSRSRSPKK